MIRKLTGACAAIMVAFAPAHAESGRWVRAESGHFVVYSDLSAKTAAAYLYKLEQYRYILSRFHGYSAEDDADMPKVKVYFVSTTKDLKLTWPEAGSEVQGYYKSCAEDRAMIGLDQDGSGIRKTHDARAQDENASQTVLFHEYAHTFMFQTSEIIYPKWFVEGYAEYYSTTRIQDDTALIGMAFSWRITDLIRPGAAHLKYEDILRDSWRPAKEDDRKTDAFYAQSWLLTHYILSDPERMARMPAFIEAYGRGDDPVKAFEAAFGVPAADLDKVLSRYLDKLMATEYRVKDMPAPAITVSSMPASADRLLLLDAADRLCPKPADRPGLLDNIRTEAAKYPGDDYAQTVLARAEIIIGDESKALDYLKAFTAAHPDDADGWFMLGQTWFLMTAHKHILEGETRQSQLAHAKTALGRSYTLDPLNAANLYYYALAQATGDGPADDNTVNAAIQAHNLAPSEEGYALFAARLLIDRNRLAEAKIMLYPLAANPHQPELAARVRAVIDAIDRGATAGEVRRLLSAPASPPPEDGGKTK